MFSFKFFITDYFFTAGKKEQNMEDYFMHALCTGINLSIHMDMTEKSKQLYILINTPYVIWDKDQSLIKLLPLITRQAQK